MFDIILSYIKVLFSKDARDGVLALFHFLKKSPEWQKNIYPIDTQISVQDREQVSLLQDLIDKKLETLGYPPESRRSVRSISTELTNNAFEHGATSPSDSIRLVFDVCNAYVSITVYNPEKRQKTNLSQWKQEGRKLLGIKRDGTRGRGLLLVEKLADNLQEVDNGVKAVVYKEPVVITVQESDDCDIVKISQGHKNPSLASRLDEILNSVFDRNVIVDTTGFSNGGSSSDTTMIGVYAKHLGGSTGLQLSIIGDSSLEDVLPPGTVFDSLQKAKKQLLAIRQSASNIPGYKILSKVGSGAMAVVYKARQLSLDRTVAIKVLPKRFTKKPDYVRSFFKVGKIAAKMNHNNIVQVIDIGEAGGLCYFVMEYVEGKTLYDDLLQGKVFSENEALDIIIQLARALAHAHGQGLIHRNVKPKNIMINHENVVKLADMVLARETSDIQAAKHEEGKAFGTPYYIAPEQIRGELEIDGRADIYALGATLFHMVTGRVPFEAKTPTEVMKKHLKEALTPPDYINTSLSTGISEMIETMMAKDPKDRYNNMEELLADLEEVREGRPPIQARRKFNLESLIDSAGMPSNESGSDTYSSKVIARYRILLVALGVLTGVFFLSLTFMLLHK
ncbi:MAG: protein kinase [Sedimentisphaerales bacterium]|nr:protein kinase [Sedimentisphaerales bacterium]